jgi:hypothetical protein
MRLTTVDFRLVGRARERKRALVNEAVKGVNFAARGGVVESFALPDGCVVRFVLWNGRNTS